MCASCVYACVCVRACADPEILHRRWLMGWLPIVNYTGVRGPGWLVNNDGRLQCYTAKLRNSEGVASHPIHPPGSAPDDVTTYRFLFVVQQYQSSADAV